MARYKAINTHADHRPPADNRLIVTATARRRQPKKNAAFLEMTPEAIGLLLLIVCCLSKEASRISLKIYTKEERKQKEKKPGIKR